MVHVLLKFLSEWREFPSAPCLAGGRGRGGGIDDSSRLDDVEIARVALTCFLSVSVTRKALQFGT
jgi:hypothetical protein